MFDPAVQSLLDQAKNSTSDVLKSLDAHHNALAVLVGQLQTTVSALPLILLGVAALTDADKATLSAQVSDLANAASTATADIAKNTPLEAGNTQQPAPAPVPAPATAAVDPNAPAT